MITETKIQFVNDTIISEPYEATEDGQKYLDDMTFKKNDIINVEIWQTENHIIQVLFLDIAGEPFGWIEKKDITVIV